MSPLSTESLSLFMSPTELRVAHWRGLPGKIVSTSVHPVNTPKDDDWKEAVSILAGILRETPCPRMRLTLSGHFTHCRPVPWRDDLNDLEEELAVVRMGFIETYGEQASRWNILLSDEPPGLPRVAFALDPHFLEAVEACAATAEVRLTSVQPYLIAVINHWRRHFPRNKSRWLVVHEKNLASLALIDRGRWDWVRSVRVSDDWSEHLPELVEHEILLAGSAPASPEVLVFAPENPALSLQMGTRLPFRSLSIQEQRGFSPHRQGAFSFAMMGT